MTGVLDYPLQSHEGGPEESVSTLTKQMGCILLIRITVPLFRVKTGVIQLANSLSPYTKIIGSVFSWRYAIPRLVFPNGILSLTGWF